MSDGGDNRRRQIEAVKAIMADYDGETVFDERLGIEVPASVGGATQQRVVRGGQAPLTREEADEVRGIRSEAALAGRGLREQFVVEARSDPAMAVKMLSTTPEGVRMLALAEEGGKSVVALVEAMSDEEFFGAVYPEEHELTEEQRLQARAARASFTNLNRAREAALMAVPLDDVPVSDAELQYEGAPEHPETEYQESVTMPRDAVMVGSDGGQYRGMGAYMMLPPSVKGVVAGILGEGFVEAAHHAAEMSPVPDEVRGAMDELDESAVVVVDDVVQP